MRRTADEVLRQVRDLHRVLEQRCGAAAGTAKDARVAMLLDYIGDGHGQLGAMFGRSLDSVSPEVLAAGCVFDFDVADALATLDRQLDPEISFDQTMSLVLQLNRQLHRALDSAVAADADRRVVAVLSLLLQRSREIRNRLVLNATLLRDF